MQQPGRCWNASDFRYGYNGIEMDNEIKGPGNSYAMEFRMYDPRLARWWSRDPVLHAWESPYAGFGSNPILYADPRGADFLDDVGEFLFGSEDSPLERGTEGLFSQIGDAFSSIDWGGIGLDVGRESVQLATYGFEEEDPKKYVFPPLKEQYVFPPLNGTPATEQSTPAESNTTSGTLDNNPLMDVQNMQPSEQVKTFIKLYETYSKYIYGDGRTKKDPQKGFATIGYGHLIHRSRKDNCDVCIGFANGLDEKEANTLFEHDLETRAACYVRQYVKVQLTQNEFDALVSFTFHIGGGNLAQSNLLVMVNKRQRVKYDNKDFLNKGFLRFIRSNGTVEQGLINRDTDEWEIFINGEYHRDR